MKSAKDFRSDAPARGTGARRALMPIKRPRYSEVADLLRLAILTERYPVGALLPSESELCQQFGVSRHTVREATRILQMRGLVSRHRGRGTEVLPKQEVSRVSRVLGSIEEVEQHGRDTHLVGIQSKMVVADKTLAMSLSCQPGDRFLHIESYRESRVQDDSWPRAWNETYIREAFEGIREELEGWQGAIYSLVERRYGERITSIRQEVSALNLSERVARKLSVKTGTAGLRVKRTYHGQAGEALLFGFNTYVGSRFSLIMDIKSHD